jgi:hypothetical protein
LQHRPGAIRETFMSKLINNVHRPKWASIMGLVHDEIITPYMIWMFRSQPDTRTIIQPQLASFGLSLRYF